MNDAIAEVTNFCSRHEWVVEVHQFVRTWNNTVLASWRGRPTEKIEVSVVCKYMHGCILTGIA